LIELTPERITAVTGIRIAAEGSPDFAVRASIDSRRVAPGDLFFGLPGENSDGGSFAGAALAAGAWGVVVSPEHAEGVTSGADGGWVFVTDEPLAALQDLAREWRRQLGARVLGITGSYGKTTVKDIARAILPGQVHATEENFNTEIGLPLTILSAPAGTDLLVLEMAMRGFGQIELLVNIAEPEVGVITGVGPVHVEMVGSVEGVARAKAELIDGLPDDGTLVAPAEAGLLASHLERAPAIIRFGSGGQVFAESVERSGDGLNAVVRTPDWTGQFSFPFPELHNLDNALAAIAAGVALGFDPGEMSARAGRIRFSSLRGERIALPGDSVLLNDCYNANPVSMKSALEHLASHSDASQRIAVLGLMGELGEESDAFHAEVGELARELGIETVIGVGPLANGYGPDHLVEGPEEAAALLRGLLEPGSVVLVKGSRSAGLEAVAARLAEMGAGPDG